MPLVRIPEQQIKWLLFQDLTRRATRERESATVTALAHYAEPASRQLELQRLLKEQSEQQAMLGRLERLMGMDIDEPITPKALQTAKEIIADIVTFALSNVELSAPDIFSTNDGRLSFEWQPHKTGDDLIGSILLAVDGATADFQIERYIGPGIEVILSEEHAELSMVKEFLRRLVEAISQPMSKKSNT